MKFISHRGNINGRIKDKENRPDYIVSAIKRGYDVEVDVWKKDDKLYLGHDLPDYEINIQFIKDINFFAWVHCKNIEAFLELSKIANCFYHTDEDYVLTSLSYIWAYPGKKLYPKMIAVLPEIVGEQDLSICSGICSDNIEFYRENILSKYKL